MLLETLARPDVREPVLEALKSAPESADAGEDPLVLSGITWAQYLEIDEPLGHERSTPRMYFCEGELEIRPRPSVTRRSKNGLLIYWEITCSKSASKSHHTGRRPSRS